MHPSAPSSLNLRVDLSRFFCLAKRGDRGKHSNVREIERKARREKIDEDTLRFKLDGALEWDFGCFGKQRFITNEKKSKKMDGSHLRQNCSIFKMFCWAYSEAIRSLSGLMPVL